MTDEERRELPAGWVWTTLGEICTKPQYGYTTKASAVPKGPRFLRITDITRDGGIDWDSVPYCEEPPADPQKYKLSEGDLVVARAGSVGESYRVTSPPDAVFASYLIRLRAVGVLEKYLEYFLQSPDYWRQIAESSTGITIFNVNATKLARIWLPLAPLPEQHRIVAEIEKQFTRLDAGLAALKRAQANLRRYKAAVLKAACEGRLVPTEADLARAEGRDYEPASQLLQRILAERRAKWEADELAKMRARGKEPRDDRWKRRYKEPAPPDTDGLPALPEGWVWATLPQIGELARGKSRHRPRNDERLFGGPYPFVQTGAIRQAEGTITSYSQTYSEFGLAQSRLWPKGTLCITIAANIADTAILGFDACFPDSVVGFIAEGDGCDVRFIEHYIRTVKEDLERYAPATAQKNINLETLQRLAIALPPLTEQHRIVAEVERRLSVVQELEAAVETNLKRAERMRQAILKRAFEGRLVPQDPADEPAGVLLERIRAEGVDGKASKKKGEQLRLGGM